MVLLARSTTLLLFTIKVSVQIEQYLSWLYTAAEDNIADAFKPCAELNEQVHPHQVGSHSPLTTLMNSSQCSTLSITPLPGLCPTLHTAAFQFFHDLAYIKVVS